MGIYQNEWIYSAGNWHELNQAGFTGGGTARVEDRFDFSGGVEGTRFFLKNCGFTNDKVPLDSNFERERQNTAPVINFEELE